MRSVIRLPRLLASLLTLGGLLVAAGLGGLAARQDDPAATAATPPTTWVVDPVHSTVIFRIQHLGAGMFYGRFNQPTGTVRWNGEGSDCPEFDITIPIDNVDSANDNLDGHLKSADFFNAKEFPQMTFRSTSCRPERDSSWRVTGDLTMLGTTRPITTTLDLTGLADKGRGQRAGFEGWFDIKRTDFGMNWGVDRGSLGDEVRIIVALEVIEEKN